MPVYSTSCTDGRLEERRPPVPARGRVHTLPSRATVERFRSRVGAVCTLWPGTASPRVARDFTAETLESWGLAELAEDAVVIVSELVTNAIRHGLPAEGDSKRPVKLSLVRDGGFIVCIVTDPSTQDPAMRAPEETCENGRGLHVIDALSRTWGWTPLPGRGKAVWAALDIP